MNIELWKKRKKELGLSYSDIATATGCSLRSVMYLFSGKTQFPRIETVNAIEKTLGLELTKSPYEVKDVKIVEVAEYMPPLKKRLVEAFDGLSEPLKEYAVEMVEGLAKSTAKKRQTVGK